VAAGSASVCILAACVVALRRRPKVIALSPITIDPLDQIYRQYGTSETLKKGAVAAASQDALGGQNTIVLPPNGAMAVYGWLEPLDAQARRLPVKAKSVRIGRHSSNDIVLDNATVHRQHAVLTINKNNRFELRDLGGVNGSLVNGKRCSQMLLGDGDVIEFGEVRFRFHQSMETVA
jgi:hypothetical protein